MNVASSGWKCDIWVVLVAAMHLTCVGTLYYLALAFDHECIRPAGASFIFSFHELTDHLCIFTNPNQETFICIPGYTERQVNNR